MDQHASGISRREAMLRVSALLGGAALSGGDGLLAFSFDSDTLSRAMAQGAGTFTADDVALLDEIAETILPETSTPGAKAAKAGAFMALMVTEAYTEPRRQVFAAGLRQLRDASFMTASPAQRLTQLEALDREQKTAMDSREPGTSEPAHFFRMMKELALLGYFTSEIGYTRAMRYLETPGRFDPCATHTTGDKSWAPHA